MVSQDLIDKYIRTALLFSQMSHCERLKVGAILVKKGSILAHAWNGTPTKYYTNQCELPDGSTNPLVLHAEQNLIVKMATSTESIKGSDIFCTHSPCPDCAKMLYQCGIKSFYYIEEYRNTIGIDMLKEMGVLCVHLTNYRLNMCQ